MGYVEFCLHGLVLSMHTAFCTVHEHTGLGLFLGTFMLLWNIHTFKTSGIPPLPAIVTKVRFLFFAKLNKVFLRKEKDFNCKFLSPYLWKKWTLEKATVERETYWKTVYMDTPVSVTLQSLFFLSCVIDYFILMFAWYESNPFWNSQHPKFRV